MRSSNSILSYRFLRLDIAGFELFSHEQHGGPLQVLSPGPRVQEELLIVSRLVGVAVEQTVLIHGDGRPDRVAPSFARVAGIGQALAMPRKYCLLRSRLPGLYPGN